MQLLPDGPSVCPANWLPVGITFVEVPLAYILYTRRSLHLPFLHNGKGSYLRRDYTAVMPTPYYPIQHVVLCYAIPSEDTHPPLNSEKDPGLILSKALFCARL